MISQFPKKKCIGFLYKLGRLFIEDKPTFTKKQKPLSSAVCRDFMTVQIKKFVCPLFEKSFQVRPFCIWITERIGLTELHFQFVSFLAVIQIFGSF
jgi:hypothetical protein